MSEIITQEIITKCRIETNRKKFNRTWIGGPKYEELRNLMKNEILKIPPRKGTDQRKIKLFVDGVHFANITHKNGKTEATLEDYPKFLDYF